MLSGNSLLHVNQSLGKAFVPGKVKGYYNDLTEKVLRDTDSLRNKTLPRMQNEKGEWIVFPTTIFQYGLGCYDLILLDCKPEYISQFKKCVVWAVENQDENGGWDVAAFAGIDSPYGAMAQAEGCSLLLRAYMYYNDEEYLKCAKRAIDLMLTPTNDGGTAVYEESDLVLLEFTNCLPVLNGWIFALFGLYDYSIVTEEREYKAKLLQTIRTLKRRINEYDNGYWSKYDVGNSVASPFYHKLHICQLEAMSLIDNDSIWSEYKIKFENYQNNYMNCSYAFCIKAIQKLVGK